MNQLLIASDFMTQNKEGHDLEQSNTQLIRCLRFITGIKLLHEQFEKQLRELLGLSQQREIFSKQIILLIWHNFQNLEQFKVSDQSELQSNELGNDLLNAVPFRLHATYTHTPDTLVQKHYNMLSQRLKEYFHRKRTLIAEKEADELKALILSGSTIAGQPSRMVQYLHQAKSLLARINAQVYGNQIITVVNSFFDGAIQYIAEPLFNKQNDENDNPNGDSNKEDESKQDEKFIIHTGFGKGKGKGGGKGKSQIDFYNAQIQNQSSVQSKKFSNNIQFTDDVFDVKVRSHNTQIQTFKNILCQSDVIYEFQLNFRATDREIIQKVHESFYQNIDQQLLSRTACSGKLIHKMNQLRIENGFKSAEEEFYGFIRDVYTVILYYNAMFQYCGNHLQFQTLISMQQARLLSQTNWQCKCEAHLFQSVINTCYSQFYTMHEVDTLFGGTKELEKMFDINSSNLYMYICQPVGIYEIIIDVLKHIKNAIEQRGSTFLLIIPMIYMFDQNIYSLFQKIFPVDTEVLEWGKQPYIPPHISQKHGSHKNNQQSQYALFKTFINSQSNYESMQQLEGLQNYFRYACYAQPQLQTFIQTSSSKNAQYIQTRVMIYYVGAPENGLNDNNYEVFFQQWYKASGGVLQG